jgi:hypothetical protein
MKEILRIYLRLSTALRGGHIRTITWVVLKLIFQSILGFHCMIMTCHQQHSGDKVIRYV